jgi:uncharacterized protein YbjQ (UPF0145 family)
MSMLVVTTFEIPGMRITACKGLVRGITVRAPHIGQSFLAGLRGISGGRVGSLVTVCETAREEALLQMVQHAASLGANAVVGLRYDSGEVGTGGFAEVLAYGTAVVATPCV